MSPERPSNARSSSTSKPYARNVMSCTLPYTVLDLSQRTSSSASQCEGRSGFPSSSQYEQIEKGYLASLTPRRQGKALISQALFDRIWDVLHQPESPNETAQFRFWARKMFTLSTTHSAALDPDAPASQISQEVLLHDNLIVAVQEQIYDLLCFCHGSTGHGGRDKTCGLIRKYYTWVPKDLVSNFIKVCPTCVLKRNGKSDLKTSSPVLSDIDISRYSNTSNESAPPMIRDYLDSGYGRNFVVNEHIWDANDPSTSPLSPLVFSSGVPEDLVDEILPPISPSPPGRHYPYVGGYPMSREVGLYKGLPNGWQYRYKDYAEAHAAFLEERERTKNDPIDPRVGITIPRIPSIVPLWGPDDSRNTPIDFSELNDYEDYEDSISPIEASSGLTNNDNVDDEMSSIPVALQPSLPNKTKLSVEIDPILLALSSESTTRETEVSAATSIKGVRRAHAPPALNLDSIVTEMSLKALLTFRDRVDSETVAPNGPYSAWPDNATSCASSAGSVTSQLSPFLMTANNSTSAASSALTTPLDECERKLNDSGSGDIIGKEIAAGACELSLSTSAQAVCGL